MANGRNGPLSSLPSASSLASIAANGAARPPVSYVLLAEFDIDQGSVLKHQYPCSTGTDEHLLAEHMLPDGAHDRNEDWTVFYLNQIPPLTVDTSMLSSTTTTNAGRADDSGLKAAAGSGPGAELLYVMSLVRTKKDATVRRGALVKALAVVSPSPYIQIYKPILLLALEDYFKEPSIECLSRLYRAINSMDLSQMPILSRDERIVLRTSERKDVFEEKFRSLLLSAAESPTSSRLPTSKLPSSSSLAEIMDDSQEIIDGSDARSVSSGGGLSLDSGSLNRSTDNLTPRSRADTMTSASSGDGRLSQHSAGAGGVGSLLPGNERSTTPMPHAGRPKDTHYFETRITYTGIPLPIRIPLSTFPEEIGDYSLINLVQTFSTPGSVVTGPFHPHLHTNGLATHPIILLFNALVTHKRVVFLGHGLAAGKVTDLVLAACALGSGCGSVLQGFTSRAFPYTNLTNLDHLEQVDGFIAGVCNPAFADRPSWWDVLCNIETGKIVVSKDVRPAPPFSRTITKTNASGGIESAGPTDEATTGAGAKGGADSPDNAFIDEILAAISVHYGEAVIRARFTDYVQRFVRLASRYEEDGGGSPTTIGYRSVPFSSYRNGSLGGGIFFADEATGLKEMQSNAGRIEGWRLTPSYLLYQKAFAAHRRDSPVQGFDLPHQIARLRHGRKMPDAEVLLIIKSLLDEATTDEQIIAILAQLPTHYGGLLPIALGLFHPQEVIRTYTLDLLERFDSHPTGNKLVQSLNAFHRQAYIRMLQQQRQHDVVEASPKLLVQDSPTLSLGYPPSLPPKEY